MGLIDIDSQKALTSEVLFVLVLGVTNVMSVVLFIVNDPYENSSIKWPDYWTS